MHVHVCQGMVLCKGILARLSRVLTILAPSRHHDMDSTIPAAARRKAMHYVQLLCNCKEMHDTQEQVQGIM